MSSRRPIFVFVLLIFCAGFAISQDHSPVSIELTGAFTSASLSNSSTWGWFNPSKYDSWLPTEDDEFGFAAARLIWNHPKYPLYLGGEWYPKLIADGAVAPTDDTAGYIDQLYGDLEAYDLALGQHYGDDQRPQITPWFGVTQIRINESRNRVPVADTTETPSYSSAQSRLWGVIVGFDAEAPISPTLVAIGTTVVRWARGSRDAEITTESPPTTASQSDDTDITMWGAELGVRWFVSDAVQLSAGWRYRDWTYDHGPASFSGPFIRCGVDF